MNLEGTVSITLVDYNKIIERDENQKEEISRLKKFENDFNRQLEKDRNELIKGITQDLAKVTTDFVVGIIDENYEYRVIEAHYIKEEVIKHFKETRNLDIT